MHSNVRCSILNQFQHIPKKRLANCFLMSLSHQNLKDEFSHAMNIYDQSNATNMFRVRFSLDEHQKKWAETIMDMYNFRSLQQAINCCLIVCQDHPNFSVATLAVYADEEYSSKS